MPFPSLGFGLLLLFGVFAAPHITDFEEADIRLHLVDADDPGPAEPLRPVAHTDLTVISIGSAIALTVICAACALLIRPRKHCALYFVPYYGFALYMTWAIPQALSNVAPSLNSNAKCDLGADPSPNNKLFLTSTLLPIGVFVFFGIMLRICFSKATYLQNNPRTMYRELFELMADISADNATMVLELFGRPYLSACYPVLFPLTLWSFTCIQLFALVFNTPVELLACIEEHAPSTEEITIGDPNQEAKRIRQVVTGFFPKVEDTVQGACLACLIVMKWPQDGVAFDLSWEAISLLFIFKDFLLYLAPDNRLAQVRAGDRQRGEQKKELYEGAKEQAQVYLGLAGKHDPTATTQLAITDNSRSVHTKQSGKQSAPHQDSASRRKPIVTELE
eukprot:TRINITY_DN96054_c0_g1_i1.p1 TRINITY_DN96054_c0_g1~~TRINITY_DN96054_c0_g1_i1.p1  ORF type:complete len:391 (-),score=12.19 TRINITY_DN96054_c0_g1_i1:69-1241(-)